MTLWYVDSAATGTNAGTSWANAWNELNQIVWASVQPGDTIYIDGGSTRPTSPFHASNTTPFDFTATKPGQTGGGGKLYQTTLTVGKSGTAAAPITIQLAPDVNRNGAVCIYGKRLTSLPYATQTTYTFTTAGVLDNGILIGNFSYIVIDGLHRSGIVIYGCNKAGIDNSVTTSSNVTYRNLEIFDCGEATLDNNNTPSVTNSLTDTATTPNATFGGVTAGVWPHGWWTDYPAIMLEGTYQTVDRCLIHDNGQDAIQQSAGSLHNITVQNSWLYFSRQNPSYLGYGFNIGYNDLGTHSDAFQILGGTPDGPFVFDHCLFGPFIGHGALLGDTGVVTNSVLFNHVTYLQNITLDISTSGNTVSNWTFSNCTLYNYNGDSPTTSQIGSVDSLAGTGHRFVNCTVACTVAGTHGGAYVQITSPTPGSAGNIYANIDWSNSTGGVPPSGWSSTAPGFAAPLATNTPTLNNILAVDLTPSGAAAGKGSSITSTTAMLNLIDQLNEAPSAVDCTAGNAQVTVRWQAPAFTSQAITSYTVTASPGGATATTPDGSTLSAVVTGLTNGVAYTFTVHATSSAGTTLESPASGPSTPFAATDGQGLGGGFGGRAWSGASPATPPGYVWGFVGTPGGEWNRWQMLGGYEPGLTAHAPNPPVPLVTAGAPSAAGALAPAPFSLAAAAAESFPTSAALAPAPFTLSAQASYSTASAALQPAAFSLASSSAEVFTASAGLTPAAFSLSGAASEVFSASAALVPAAFSLAAQASYSTASAVLAPAAFLLAATAGEGFTAAASLTPGPFVLAAQGVYSTVSGQLQPAAFLLAAAAAERFSAAAPLVPNVFVLAAAASFTGAGSFSASATLVPDAFSLAAAVASYAATGGLVPGPFVLAASAAELLPAAAALNPAAFLLAAAAQTFYAAAGLTLAPFTLASNTAETWSGAAPLAPAAFTMLATGAETWPVSGALVPAAFLFAAAAGEVLAAAAPLALAPFLLATAAAELLGASGQLAPAPFSLAEQAAYSAAAATLQPAAFLLAITALTGGIAPPVRLPLVALLLPREGTVSILRQETEVLVG